MKRIQSFFKSLHFTNLPFALGGILVVCFVFAYFEPIILPVATILLVLVAILFVADVVLLYSGFKRIQVERLMETRFSNGDDNVIKLYVENRYIFKVNAQVVEEAPQQFQIRNLAFSLSLKPGQLKIITYKLRPTERGKYFFGNCNVFAASPISMVTRRFILGKREMVKVYPSFLNLRKYEFLALQDNLQLMGIKKIRKLGNTHEFEQIRDYVVGDDYRFTNWKATARKSKLMVNQYVDEKAQPVYNIIDTGRVMQLAFKGLKLLDHSINAALVLSNVALKKHDKAGIVTFNHKVQNVLPANRRPIQMNLILEMLYATKTRFKETSFAALHQMSRRQLNQRSLAIIYTNFESLSSAKARIPYLASIAKKHLTLVVFFKNIELFQLINKTPNTVTDIYIQTIAEQFAYEKEQIVLELSKHGIHALLTSPEDLTVDAINKYLEFKARGAI